MFTRLCSLCLLVFSVMNCISCGTTTTNQLIHNPELPYGGIIIHHPESGMQTFPTPRHFDGPGTLYRVDGNGTRFRIADLSDRVSISRNREVMPKQRGNYSSESTKAGFLQFLGLSGGAEKQQEDRFSYSIELKDGWREQTDDEPLRSLALDLVRNGHYDPQETFYLIRETIDFSQVSLALDRNASQELGGEVAVTEMARASGYDIENGTDQLRMVESWDAPLRVFFKADQIVLVDPKGGISEYIVRPVVHFLPWE
jgi:hypothetical protein